MLGFYSDAVECLTATREILVRSSAGTKRCLAFFYLLQYHVCLYSSLNVSNVQKLEI